MWKYRPAEVLVQTTQRSSQIRAGGEGKRNAQLDWYGTSDRRKAGTGVCLVTKRRSCRVFCALREIGSLDVSNWPSTKCSSWIDSVRGNCPAGMWSPWNCFVWRVYFPPASHTSAPVRGRRAAFDLSCGERFHPLNWGVIRLIWNTKKKKAISQADWCEENILRSLLPQCIFHVWVASSSKRADVRLWYCYIATNPELHPIIAKRSAKEKNTRDVTSIVRHL